jgi:hypothetical protein
MEMIIALVTINRDTKKMMRHRGKKKNKVKDICHAMDGITISHDI